MGRHACYCHRRPCECGSDAPDELIMMRFTPETFEILLAVELRWFQAFMEVAGRGGDSQLWHGAARMMLATRLNALAN
jgi:hypothetical protein